MLCHVNKVTFKCISKNQCVFNITRHAISMFTPDPNGNNAAWHKAISKAEKLVGFPTSFLSLRALLSNELQGMAGHLKKFVETKHPLLKTARGILFDSKNYLQTRGLVTLLISKCAASTNKLGSPEFYNSTETLYAKQRSLAEVAELINLGFLIHRGLVDVEAAVNENNVTKTDMEIGNKIALLGGDFFLSNATMGLSKLSNTEVVGIMSNSIIDMSAGFFRLPENSEELTNQCLKEIPTNLHTWEEATFLAHGSLLSNSCISSLVLGDYNTELQQAAKLYGKYFALAQQANLDINRFNSFSNLLHNPASTSICTLPFLVFKEDQNIETEDYVVSVKENTFKVDHKKIYKAITTKYEDTISKSRIICNEYSDKAVQSLDIFPTSDAKNALITIANSVKY